MILAGSRTKPLAIMALVAIDSLGVIDESVMHLVLSDEECRASVLLEDKVHKCFTPR